MKIEYVVLIIGAALVIIPRLAKAFESSETSTDLRDSDLPNGRGRGDRVSTMPERATPADLDSSETCIARAHDLFGKGRGSDALRILDDAISRNPDNAKLHIALGIMLHKFCHPKHALVYFERAIELDQGAADAHAGRAYILYNFALYGETCDSVVPYEEVYDSLERAKEFGCNDAKLYRHIGLTLEFLARKHPSLSTGFRVIAIESLQRALDLDRHHFDTQCALKHVKGRLA